jgi:hypothetical protein
MTCAGQTHLVFRRLRWGGPSSSSRAAGFFNIRPDSNAVAPNPSIRFLVANTERLIIDNEGFIGLGGVLNPTNPIQHANGAFLSAAGLWTNGSSRAYKQEIETLGLGDAKATSSSSFVLSS